MDMVLQKDVKHPTKLLYRFFNSARHIVFEFVLKRNLSRKGGNSNDS